MQIGKDIDRAAAELTAGNLVAIPTETVYGLAANAFDINAVLKIYKAKNRPQFNPLIIHSSSLDKFKTWGIILPELALKLAKVFSPGPLTYIVKKSNAIPDIVTAGNDSVAIRIPRHPLTLKLLENINFPIAAPSANPSGFISPTNALHVFEQLGEKLAYILDGGDCEVGLESTIISFLDKTPKILRFGGVSKEQIEKILELEVDIHKPSNKNPENSGLIISPGMLSRHYAPKTKLIIGNPTELLTEFNPKKVAIISFSKNYEMIPSSQMFVLSPEGSLEEAASCLFNVMRLVDKLDIDLIIAERFPESGIGVAINDRLTRASAS